MLPFIRHRPVDWLTSGACRALDYQEQGWYRALRDIAWQRGPYEHETPPVLPADPLKLARLLGVHPTDFKNHWDRLATYLETDGENVWHAEDMAEYRRALEKVTRMREMGSRGGKRTLERTVEPTVEPTVKRQQTVRSSRLKTEDSRTEKTSIPSGSSTQRPEQLSHSSGGGGDYARAREPDAPPQGEYLHGDPTECIMLRFPSASLPNAQKMAERLMVEYPTTEQMAAALDRALEKATADGKADPYRWIWGCIRNGGLGSWLSAPRRETPDERMDRIERELRDEGVNL